MLLDPLLRKARALAQQREWAALCLVLEEEQRRTPLAPDAELLLAEGLLRSGRALEAAALLGALLPRVARLAPPASLRHATNLRGAALFELGDVEDAEACFQHALELARTSADHLLVARATNNLAMICNLRGQHVEALAAYRVALASYQHVGYELGLGECYHNMAITYRDQDELDLADECEQRAAEVAGEIGDTRLRATAHVGRAELQLRRGDPHMAEATALRAATDFARVLDPARRADAVRVAGTARALRGDDVGASALFDQATDEARACGAALIEAEALRARAQCAWRRGQRDHALADAGRARVLFERLDATHDHEAIVRWIHAVERAAQN